MIPKFTTVENIEQAHERYHNIAADQTEYNGQVIDLAEVYLRFANSDYGQQTAQATPRFYKKFPVTPDFQTHIDVLGADSHRVEHMLYTASEIVIPALVWQQYDGYKPQLSQADQVALKLAGIIHDVGECEHLELKDAGFRIVGDVPSMDRTEDDEATEAKIRTEFFYPKLYSDIPDNLLERTEEISSHNGPGFAPEMFMYLEKYGYLVTAHKAAKLAVKLYAQPEITEQNRQIADKLIQLADSVRDHNYPDLSRSAQEIKIIEKNLYTMSGDIIFASHHIQSRAPATVV